MTRPTSRIRSTNKRRDALVSTVRSCVTVGDPPEVNFSLPRHTVITPVLHQFAYDPAFCGRSIPIVFRDGSRPPRFPIGCLGDLPQTPRPAQRVVNLGMSSLRHPDMDYLVDLYLVRNRDLNDQPTMAAEEALTYQRAVELLADPVLATDTLIQVFHSGLEPMIVGFYRGVVDVLARRRQERSARGLAIQPFLFMQKSAKTNLSPESPGARAESYEPGGRWC